MYKIPYILQFCITFLVIDPGILARVKQLITVAIGIFLVSLGSKNTNFDLRNLI